MVQRLRSRPQFQAVLAGDTVARTRHFALHRCSLAMPEATLQQKPLFPAHDVWLGALVPKRWARRAVTRNGVKRQVYQVVGDAAACWPAQAYVVRLRSGFDAAQFPSASSAALKQAVRAELLQLCARFGVPSTAP